MILVDDLGWNDVGFQGSTFYQTPELDRLAERGLRFTRGYAACQVCSPSRASLMTGRFPPRHGITDYIGALARVRTGSGTLRCCRPSTR
ncbi:MAG: sulfatase-like hydrolase/transferase [Pirellulaceae bacterium]